MNKLAAVREKFILSLQDKAEELESSLEETIDTGPLTNLHSLVHKIAGSAGFYGQQDVAALATEIDKVMESADGSTASEPMQKDIRRLIELMRNCDV